jgi:hypothetical protein
LTEEAEIVVTEAVVVSEGVVASQSIGGAAASRLMEEVVASPKVGRTAVAISFQTRARLLWLKLNFVFRQK